MSQLEQLKTELWALFDRIEKDTTGKGIKTGLVAAQAIVAKHTDGFALVPVEQAADSARLDFLFSGSYLVQEDTIWDENGDVFARGMVVSSVFWIDGWEPIKKSVAESKREAIDKAIEAQEQNNG